MEAMLKNNKTLVFSYIEHRLTIGLLGTTLPIVAAIGAAIFWGTGIQSSVSKYYHTGTGDYFVGVLFAISLLLMSYVGYTDDENAFLSDNAVANLAGIFGLCTALVPTTPVGYVSGAAKIAGYFHLGFAAAFFISLIYFCLALFPKTKGGKPVEEGSMKEKRNKIFKMCGYTMIGCMLLVVVYFLFEDGFLSFLKKYNPIFWLEAIMVMIFGYSWLIKGGAFYKDAVKTAESN